jgi:hypothetical protein
MKIKLTALSAVLLALGSSQIHAKIHNTAESPTGPSGLKKIILPQLGDYNHGGLVFWVTPDNLHGYSAYPTALTAGTFASTTPNWGNAVNALGGAVGGITATNTASPFIAGAIHRGLGGGAPNTAAIMHMYQIGSSTNAPTIVPAYAIAVSADYAGGTCTSSSVAGSGVTFAQTANTDQCHGSYYLGNIEETVQALYASCYYNNGATSGLPVGTYWTSNVVPGTAANAYAVTYTSCTASTTKDPITNAYYGTPVITVASAAMTTATYKGVAVRAW